MKLLVTTDFSTNSKGAIRFAQTLSRQAADIEVIFFHAIQIIKPTVWSDDFFNDYRGEEIDRLKIELKEFIHATIDGDSGNFAKAKYVVENCVSTEHEIITYAVNNHIDFICIATQGASMLRKIMGTHTSYIVNNSKVPVIVIPSHYETKNLKKATYFSDFENLSNEVLKISQFSTPMALDIEVLHYSSMALDHIKLEKNKALFDTKEFENCTLNIQEGNYELSLVERIAKYVEKTNPELLIMFTKREKGFFESIFLPSKSAELTYSTKVPVLIFSK